MNHLPEYYASKPASLPDGLPNNERLNILLNSCQNPRAVYNALMDFVKAVRGDTV